MTNHGAGGEDEGMEMVEGIMQAVVKRVEEGIYREEVFLYKVFELTEVGKAHEWMEENKAVGKVVLTIP